MSARSLIVIVLALVCGGSAAYGITYYMQNNKKPAAKTDKVPVVVAIVDIPRGSVVNAEQLKVIDLPKNEVHPDAVAKIEDAVERAALRHFKKDRQILKDELGQKGEKGAAALVPEGMRGFTINTPNVQSGMAGNIQPGNRVDVLLTIKDKGIEGPEGARGPFTVTLLQNVEILAVDRELEDDAPGTKNERSVPRSVTLKVTPRDDNLLALAQSQGSLSLSLRNPKDDAPVDPISVSLRDLPGLKALFPPTPPAKPEPPTVKDKPKETDWEIVVIDGKVKRYKMEPDKTRPEKPPEKPEEK